MRPPAGVALKVTGVPEQTDVAGLAAAVVDRAEATATVVFAVAEHPKLFNAVTVYSVLTVCVTPVGFCTAETNPEGTDDQV